MDNSSSSDSGMDDASMDDSEQEHEYDYDLEEPDAHDDYEDVPDDDDDDMDDDDDQPLDLTATITGVVNELRLFRPDMRRDNAGNFHISHFDPPILPLPREDVFRDMIRDTVANLSPSDTLRMQEQLGMRPIDLRTVEPLLFSTRVRPPPRETVALHPALHRPYVPPADADRVPPYARSHLRMPFDAPPREQTHGATLEALARLQQVSAEVNGAPQHQSDLLTRLSPQPLAALQQVDLLRSVTPARHADNPVPGFSRSRPFDRLSSRDRDREKVPSGLARRWSYEPQSSGGDALPTMFDPDAAHRRSNRVSSRQPLVATETHESVNELANKITNRLDALMMQLFSIDDEVETVEKNIERKKKEAEKKKAEEAKKAEEEKKRKEAEEASTAEAATAQGEGDDKQKMDVTETSAEAQTSTVPEAAEAGQPVQREQDPGDRIEEEVTADVAEPGNVPRPEASRTAPGLTNAQEEAPRPDLVMDSVEIAQRRSEEQRSPSPEANATADNPENTTEAAENDNEPPSTDFAAVAARRAAAAGISLDAPANENPEVVAAATESTGIDPAFLAALPEEMRTEILTQYYEQLRTNPDNGQQGPSSAAGATTVNQDFLIALPPALRAEVLELEAEFQSRQEATNNANGGGNGSSGGDGQNNGALAAAEMDNATFLATLAPELREEILLESGEAFIRSLPPNMAAEARILRERDLSSRLPWRVNRQDLSSLGFDRRGFSSGMRDTPMSGRRGERSQTREAPIYRWKKVDNIWLREGPNVEDEPKAALQSDGISALSQLLWHRQGQYGKTLTYQVLSHACRATESRNRVLNQLIKLITSNSSTDGSPGSSKDPGRLEHDRARLHGTAVRRGLELLTMLCKNDAVVAETLLGLPKTADELKEYGTITLSDSAEIVEASALRISLSTLVSLLSDPLFVRSNSHLEQLVGVISTVCYSIPSSKLNSPDSPSERHLSRSILDRPSLSTGMGDPMNFFVVDGDDDAQPVFDVHDDDGEDDDDSEEDLFDVLRRARRRSETSPRPTDTEKPKEGEIDESVPNQFRIPKLKSRELVELSKVLLRSGCGEKTYDRVSRTIGLLGELQANRTTFVSSLASIAADAGRDIQKEYEECIRALCGSSDPKGKQNRADVISSFSVASATNELTLLRVVKSLSTLLKHETSQAKESASERLNDEGEKNASASGIFENPFQTSMLHGLYKLWEALDKLLDLVSDETKLKDKKSGEASAVPSAAEVLHADRRRAAKRGLSPILARLSPIIEAFLVTHAAEAGKESTGETVPSSSSPKVTLDNLSTPTSPAKSRDLESESTLRTLDGELALFVEKHRGPINALLRANPALLETSFKGALRHPQAIDFDNKKAYFRNVIRRRSSEAHAGTIRINVRRDRVFDDSYHQLRMRTPDELKGRLHVQFNGEEGVDAGGVTREWYVILARQIFDPNYALFTRSAAKAATYQPDKRSYINREHLENFRFVGRIIGKAIYDGQLLDAYFTRSFYKHILGLKPTYHDIEAQDPEYYKSLKWMLENDCTGILDYTMSAEYDEFGKQTVIDLVPNGRTVPVTEENKAEYVRLVTDVRMTKAIEKQIEAFKEGFYELIPYEDCKIFNELELELLMSGLPDIDMADLKANVEYTGYTASSPQINWFWRCVGKMDQEDLARLVMFVTGTSKVPLEGFSQLQGMNGIQKFQIHRVAGDSMRLPSAHTCFNQLDVPEYSSAEILSERLLRAVRECSVGFGFA